MSWEQIVRWVWNYHAPSLICQTQTSNANQETGSPLERRGINELRNLFEILMHRYCGNKSPNVKQRNSLKVIFTSNQKNDGGSGALCAVKCLDNNMGTLELFGLESRPCYRKV